MAKTKDDVKVGDTLRRNDIVYRVERLLDTQFVVKPTDGGPPLYLGYQKLENFVRIETDKDAGEVKPRAKDSAADVKPVRRAKVAKTEPVVPISPVAARLRARRQAKKTAAAPPPKAALEPVKPNLDDENETKFRSVVYAALLKAQKSTFSRDIVPRSSSWIAAELLRDPDKSTEPRVRAVLETLVAAGKVDRTIENGVSMYRTAINEPARSDSAQS